MTVNLKKLLTKQDIIILPPQDVMETFDLIDFHVSTVMLDPWYNRGHGGRKRRLHALDLNGIGKVWENIGSHIPMGISRYHLPGIRTHARRLRTGFLADMGL